MVSQRLIVDTGPLLDLLLYRFWTEQGYRLDENRFQCQKQHTVSPDQLLRFFGTRREIIFVPGVFVEVGRLAQNEIKRAASQAKEISLATFWKAAFRELHLMRSEERWTKFLSLDQELVEKFGPMDAALMQCAKETGEERVPILTHDEPLWGRCQKQNISCMLTSEILQWL